MRTQKSCRSQSEPETYQAIACLFELDHKYIYHISNISINCQSETNLDTKPQLRFDKSSTQWVMENE